MIGKVRKQVYDLTLEDLQQHPVWEFALDEEGEKNQDEATVRPCERRGPFDPNEGMVIVKARFTLADGSTMLGYLTPPTRGNDLGIIQPQIVTLMGQISFWYGSLEPSRDTLDGNYKLLGRQADRVFPLQFSSDVEVVGGPVAGVLSGFSYFVLQTNQVRVVK